MAADEQDLAVSRIGRYRERRSIALSETGTEAAALSARMVPGLAGIILFCAARGDTRDEVARLLKISGEEVDDVLARRDGVHHRRP